LQEKLEAEEGVWSMTVLAHRENMSFPPDIFAWLEGPFVSARPVAAQAMRMEEHVAGGRYVVRAELPGVDPAKDMEVSVSKGILTVHAERHEENQGQHRSEFRYGTFTRHIALPVTADANDIKATYHWGILEVSIGLHDAGEDKAGRRIPVQTTTA
jgi:HSP20 family protein